jgi:hypothetical protein
MALSDTYKARQLADGTWKITVSRRFLVQFGLRTRTETQTFTASRAPRSQGDAWRMLRASRRGGPAHKPSLRARNDAVKRAAMTASLMSVTCPDCNAAPGIPCDYGVATEMVRIDRLPHLLVIHSARIADAIEAGAARRADVLAQFAGQPPQALNP